MHQTAKKIVILTGPTAAGKSNLAIKISRYVNGVVVNADAMQIYQEIPIVSAAPHTSCDIEHQLYSYITGDQNFSVAKWLIALRQVLDDCFSHDKIPIVTGGSTMYIRLLIDGLSNMPAIDENIQKEAKKLLCDKGNAEFHKLLLSIDKESGNKILPSDTQRMLRAYNVKRSTGQSILCFRKTQQTMLKPDEKIIKLALVPPRECIYRNCHSRFIEMIQEGAIDEVRELSQQHYPPERSIYKAIGVREIQSYLSESITRDDMITLTTNSTRQYAKRQMTWIRNKFHDFLKLSDPDTDPKQIASLILE